MSADHFPRSLSASRIGDFTTCPLLFRFRTIDRIPEPPAPAAIMGTLMHTALEDLFDLPAVDRTPDAAHELFEAAWVELQEEDVKAAAAVIDRIGSAPDLIASYFAIEDPVRLEPHAREFEFETPLTPTFNIRGYVDRIDKAPDGRIRIVDYKTGKAPRPQYQDKPMFQMRFYALAWWRIHEVVPAMLRLLFLGNREILR
jgi:putative RecB family exonuclease